MASEYPSCKIVEIPTSLPSLKELTKRSHDIVIETHKPAAVSLDVKLYCGGISGRLNNNIGFVAQASKMLM